jgi:biotin carboxyl carrier protein
MEHPVPAPRAGVVETVHAVAGGAVAGGDALVTLGAAETEGGERGARGGE